MAGKDICCRCENEIKRKEFIAVVNKEKTLCKNCYDEYIEISNAFLDGKEVKIITSKQSVLFS